MTLRLTRLESQVPIVDGHGKPSPQFMRLDQRVKEQIELAITQNEQTDAALAAFLDQIIDLNNLITQAQTAITDANTAIAAAEAATEAVAGQSSLINSWVEGAAPTATDAGTDVTITISAHDRVYPQPDGTNVTVSVNGGNLTGRAYSTDYAIFYDDPTRAGGAVTYQSSTNLLDAAQAGDRHSVGSVTTPAAAAPPAQGKELRPRGFVDL